MSSITLELPEDLAAKLATPEGKERAYAALAAAFRETSSGESAKQQEREGWQRHDAKIYARAEERRKLTSTKEIVR